LREYYKQRLSYKVRYMRYNVLAACSLVKIERSSLRDTKSAFFELGNEKNQASTAALFPGRMRGVSSYDVLDSTLFSHAKKVEQRLAHYNKKNRERQSIVS